MMERSRGKKQKQKHVNGAENILFKISTTEYDQNDDQSGWLYCDAA